MSIYGINGSYQQINNYRALSNMTARMNKTGKNSGTPVPPIPALGSVASKPQAPNGSLPLESVVFARHYQGEMSELMDSANDLRRLGSRTGELQVSADNAAAAEISAAFTPAQAGNYTLDVKQVATAQQNTGNAVDAAAHGLTGTLDLITTGGNASFTVDPSAKNNADALKTLAQQVNSAKLGVTASVTQKDGKATLSLASANTGESGAFLAAGSLATGTGLDKVTQKAQNASYSVRKDGGMAVERTSERNEVYVDGNMRIQAKLKTAGTVNVKVQASPSKAADGIQGMVDHYNSSLKLLNDNGERGKGVLNQMKRMLIATGDEKSMAAVGITSKKDGTLAFDKAKFAKATSEDPSLAQRVIGGSFGLADNIYTAAQQGLRQSANSLLSEDLKTAKLQQANNSMSLMASYSRNGAYAMSNYQISGALMNLLV